MVKRKLTKAKREHIRRLQREYYHAHAEYRARKAKLRAERDRKQLADPVIGERIREKKRQYRLANVERMRAQNNARNARLRAKQKEQA